MKLISSKLLLIAILSVWIIGLIKIISNAINSVKYHSGYNYYYGRKSRHNKRRDAKLYILPRDQFSDFDDW